MAKKPKQSQARESTYRGKTIRCDDKMVLVDGVPVHFERSEEGVYAHMEATYRIYGSPEELGEDLIRQWGEAQIMRHPHRKPKAGK